MQVVAEQLPSGQFSLKQHCAAPASSAQPPVVVAQALSSVWTHERQGASAVMHVAGSPPSRRQVTVASEHAGS